MIGYVLIYFQSSFDRRKKMEILKKIIRKTTALEQKWIVRLILKNMNIGMSMNVRIYT